MFKRVGLFILTNLAVIVLLQVVLFILESYFGIQLTGNTYILVIAVVFGFGGAFISLYISRWAAKKAYNIKPISKDEVYSLGEKEKAVWNIVEDLAERHHIIMPEVGIYNSPEPNAFATGASKNSSLVAVSTGLLNKMSKDEIEGVIGHEMAHILNGDMVTMTLLQGVLNTFVIFFARLVANIISNFLDEELSGLAYFGVVIVLEILFGLLAGIIAMTFSRHREFKADAGSAEFLGKEKMILALKALQKLEPAMVKVDKRDTMANFKISSKKGKGIVSLLFSSHPALEDRIKALEDSTI